MEEVKHGQATVLVGIGASAGGLQALQVFLSHLPAGAGLSVVVMFHLDPTGEALLPEVLAKSASFKVLHAEDGMLAEADHIYALPGHAVVSLEDGMLRIRRTEQLEERRTLIDTFLQSLAQDQGEKSVGVILSGAGSDGSLGLRAIAAAGGLTMVQDPSTAKQDGMPLSATEAGAADHVLPPDQLAAELLAHAAHFRRGLENQAASTLAKDVTELLPQICEVLLAATGHDFKHYKISTVIRRTIRRMQVLRIHSANEYLERLHLDRAEAERLFTELLINVTSFFRDPDAFETLSRTVLPLLLADRKPGVPVRIWVPGCSTGEEAYSLAMLFREHMDDVKQQVDVQIFATDIDQHALAVARQGQYPADIASTVSPERLKRFFVKKGHRYQISKAVRELVLFSVHNLINDPPFSKLDVVSCRNLLIYLGSHLQKKLIPLFHYSLLPGGYLFLGPSESLNTHRELFRPIDGKNRISQRLPTAIRSSPLVEGRPAVPAVMVRPPNVPAASEVDNYLLMQRIILDEFAPKAVLVTEEGQVMSASGNLEKYLTVSAGAFHNNISRLVRDELRVGLRAAFSEAIKVRRKVVHDGMSLRGPEGVQRVMLTVQPMPQLGEDTGLFMVVFQDEGLPLRTESATSGPPSAAATALIDQLERDLASTRDDLEKTVQDLEAANEELKSSNEELLSMNEELQSANEELETSKEDLQSANDALTGSNSDLENLLASTRIATLFLDESENVRRVTPDVDKIFNLLPSDTGRPLSHFTHKAKNMPPLPQARAVYSADRPVEDEVEMRDDSWYLRRVLPYRAPDGNQAGTVVTFIDVTEQRRYAESVEEERSKLAAVITVMSQGVVILSPDGQVLKMNRAALEMHGFANEEAILSQAKEFINLYDALDRDGRPLPADQWPAARVLRGEDLVNFEMHVRRRDTGHSFVGLYSGSTVRNADGQVLLAVMSINDVTHRVHAEATIKHSEERFRQLAETIPQLAWMAGPDGSIIWYNQRWYDYTGTTVEEVQGWGWQKVHDPLVLPRVMEGWTSAIERLEPFDMVFPLKGRDGTFRPFLTRVNPLKDHQGQVQMWFGTNTDVSEEHAKAEALRLREEELRSLTDNTPDVLARYDRQHRHVFVNAAAEQQTGISRDQLLGKTDRELGVADDLSALWERAIDKVFEGGEASSIEFTTKGILGTRHFAAKIVPERGADGAVHFALGVSRDITAEKAAKEALVEADRRKDEFLAMLAHELRNPLAPLRTGLQALKHVEADPPTAEKVRQMMDRQLSHMVRLVDDLLDVSRISSGKLELRHEKVAVSDVIQAAVEASAPLIEASKHNLTVRVADEPLFLHADPTRVAQAVGNLLNNAAKYTADGGNIELGAKREANEILIWVTDSGAGIEPEMLPRLFDMFTQVGQTLDRAQGGLGIGLSLVKRLIELHGGSVLAESKGHGHGSTFRIRMPLANATAPVQQPKDEAPGSLQAMARRVLVVDDNIDAAETLGMVLEMSGHHIQIAHNGPDALQMAASFDPDLVFLDIGLPGMDGHEVARRLRAQQTLRRVTLVALTGWGSEEDKRRSQQAGFDHHLIKPVAIDAIAKILADLI